MSMLYCCHNKLVQTILFVYKTYMNYEYRNILMSSLIKIILEMST